MHDQNQLAPRPCKCVGRRGRDMWPVITWNTSTFFVVLNRKMDFSYYALLVFILLQCNIQSGQMLEDYSKNSAISRWVFCEQGQAVLVISDIMLCVNGIFIYRAARNIGFIRSTRQNSVVCEENNNTLCLPEGTISAPSSLVDCIEGKPLQQWCKQYYLHSWNPCTGQCVCNDCFMINDSSGKCRICSEFSYREDIESCGLDNRQSQLTAFLLSIFLSSTGAANFYIGRNDLGIVATYVHGHYFNVMKHSWELCMRLQPKVIIFNIA